MKARRDVFQAIADPTRRDIINLIATQSYNVNSIAKQFDMTRQAISLHLQILADCGLVELRQNGRERFCEAKLDQLTEVITWIENAKKQWSNKFERLDHYLNTIKTKENEK